MNNLSTHYSEKTQLILQHRCQISAFSQYPQILRYPYSLQNHGWLLSMDSIEYYQGNIIHQLSHIYPNLFMCKYMQIITHHSQNQNTLKLKVLVTQLCPTLCDPMDCSPPASSVQGILQAKILEWVVISFSRGSSHLRD